MSLSGSLTGLSIGGLSSGIDTESIISRLLLLDQAPIQRLQAQQAQLSSKLGLMSAFRSKLGTLSSTIGSLAMASSFTGFKAIASDNTVASITASSGAAAGTYSLEVLKLAQSHKVSTAGQASANEPLGYSGEIVLNGRAITITASDTLKSIANKINENAVGVKANVIDGGPGNAFLSLSSNTIGVEGSLRMADVSGTVLADLGLLDGTQSLGNSYALGSATEEIGNQLGFNTAPSGSFSLNGVNIAANFNTDSLADLAAAINNSGSGATATIETTSGKSRLVLAGVTSQDDPDNLLHALGVLQNGFDNQLVAAQNSEYMLDGITLTGTSNTVSGVIPGATFNLMKVGTTDLTIEADTGAVKDKITDFVNAFNSLVDFVKTNTAFDKDTFETGALFADPAVARVESMVSGILYTQLKGNDGLLASLGDIGIKLNADGKLEIDEARLDGLLASDLDGISAVFQSTGTTSVKQLEFVGGTSKTKPSGAVGYQVVITALAQRLSIEAADTQTDPLAQQEILTFSGAAFNGSSHEILLEAGMTQAQIVDKINNDPKLKSVMTASVVSGKLHLEAKEVGTAASFSIISNVATGGSGWGSGNVLQAAADIQGTINGEDAVGAGNVLTGKAGNKNTDGLQVRFTGNSTGVIGSVTFSQGISNLMTGMIAGLTDSTNGYLSTNDKSIQDQIDAIARNITFKTEQMTSKKAILQARFNRMELAIAELQAQQSRIAAFTS